ncbi:MAG: carbon-nitrogen hydrolase family protein [Candidatus Velamenicoccus archaeovorus]
MGRLLTVLGAQVRPVSLDPAATLAKFEDEVAMARRTFPAADLYLFPELYLTGDDPFVPGAPADFVRRTAEPVPGPLTERVGKVAARAGRWICAGSVFERDGRDVYNTALVFDPEGRLVVRYRKLFPWQPFEGTRAGETVPPVFEVPGVGKLGVMICYDGWFPEVARGLALRGAELILHPTLTTSPDREQELILARANAIANQCYVLNVNAVPRVGGGRSIGVDPEGRVLFDLGQTEEFVVEPVDLDRVTTVRRLGTRGTNRVLHHLKRAPAAVFSPYRRFVRGG